MKKIFLLLFYLAITANSQTFAQAEKFKALFMYNFTKYIEWPVSSRQGDFVIGILGNSPITKELEVISGKQKVGSQSIVVKTFASVDAIEVCHIIYLPPSKSGQISSVSEKMAGKNTLIIADKEGLALQGAAINFIMDGDKIKYEVNKSNINHYGLAVNSSLLALGISVGN
jgi:hypothetical protein